MAALSNSYIKTQVKKILPIGDTSIFDDQLDILVGGAISKLVSEGLDVEAKDYQGNYLFEEGGNRAYDYIVCVAYQILKDMDLDVDMNFMTEQYITRVGTLRCYVSMKQRSST